MGETQLETQRRIRQLLTSTWSAFFARFGALRPVQLAAIPEILTGRDVLLTAPTAGGKTEAVAAPVCERLIGNGWPGLSVLLVTPTRALVNDLFMRLERPLGDLGIAIGRKTADHSILREGAEQFLVTTPESLESLLTFNRQRLVNLRAIIIDEIHLLDGSPRGDQLRALLGRLRVFLASRRTDQPSELQVIALSATVPEVERTAAAYLAENRRIISIAGQRGLEARVILAEGDDRQRAQAAAIAVEDFADVHKILVFVNSRKQVDLSAPHFATGALANWPVYCHHGSLSKETREHAEEGFKSAGRGICVATMTLEIGIDIGDVDLVICMDPPFSLSSFLQRIGRGCRRLQGQTRVLCVARNRAGELLFRGMIRQSTLGIPAGPVAPFRRSVLVQQVLAYLRQVDQRQRTLNQFCRVFGHATAPAVVPHVIDEVVRDMVYTELLAEHRSVFQPASAGGDFIESGRIYSNIEPEPVAITLVDADSGKPIATIAGLGQRDDAVSVAGKSYQVMPDSGSIRRVREGTQHQSAAFYVTRSLPYATDVGISARDALGLTGSQLSVIATNRQLVVMTWQGALVNSCVAEALTKLGVAARPTSFALIMSPADKDHLLRRLNAAVEELARANPLGDVEVEKLVATGPYFDLLSSDAQREARRDWLDLCYIRSWVEGLSEIVDVEIGSPLASDLMALAAL